MIENEESQKKMKYTFIKWSEIDNNELFSFYSEIKLKKVNNFL
jgi:hypothetical protein